MTFPNEQYTDQLTYRMMEILVDALTISRQGDLRPCKKVSRLVVKMVNRRVKAIIGNRREVEAGWPELKYLMTGCLQDALKILEEDQCP